MIANGKSRGLRLRVGFVVFKIISSEHAVRRQLTSKMRPRNPFMKLSDVLTTQDGIKAFLVTQDSLMLCFAFLGPTYQAARENTGDPDSEGKKL